MDLSTKIDRDKDKTLPILHDAANGDIDLRFPFTPISTYVPATEIEASFGTHIFNKYELHVVDVAEPDYSDIKQSFRPNENKQDPRLKKLFGLLDDNASTSKTNIDGLPNILPADPRKRKLEPEEPTVPKKLQIPTILQKSKHYNELSSSQKIVVNEALAELSKQLILFHDDPSPNKIFDSCFVTQRPKLQQILTGLNVFVTAEGELEEMPMGAMPTVHQLPQSFMTLNHLPPAFLGQPPLLGLAPNMLFSNLDPQDLQHMSLSPTNQGSVPFSGDRVNSGDLRIFLNRRGSNQNRGVRRQQNSGRNNRGNKSYRGNKNFWRGRRN